MSDLTEREQRLVAKLRELQIEVLWYWYNHGIERDGKWMDSAMRDAEELRNILGFRPGWHDAAMIKAAIPGLADRLVQGIIDGTKK